METEHVAYSGALGRRMRILRYGRSGPVLLYLPSSDGDEREFAAYGLPDVCAPAVVAGRLQVIAVDGRGPSTFWDDSKSPAERIARYAKVERYLTREALPWVERTAGAVDITPVGASYGGFVAANLLFKRPERFAGACGLGGVYGLWHRLDGYHDDSVYFHTPLEFLPRLEDPAILGRIRETRGLTLYAGKRDRWLDSSLRMADVLREKHLPYALNVWDADHHERFWKRQLAEFLEQGAVA